MRELVCILSTPVDVLDTQAVMGRIEQFIQEKRFHQIATANVDFIINAMSDAELRHILRDSDLVTPDGMPLVWASKTLGRPLPERVTGADIVPALADLSARKGYRLYMLGARPEVAQQARAKMLAAYPGLQIVGCVSPPVRPLDDMDSAGLLDDIRATRPDVLLVAFGNPKQEKWIYRNREALRDVPVCIGVGGTFDFMAGHTSRAPEWMRRAGLEWLHRLASEPGRLWKRYTRDIGHFGRYFGAQTRAMRPNTPRRQPLWTEARQGEYTILSVDGTLDAACQNELQARAERALGLPTGLILDLTHTDAIDAAVVGTLLNLPRHAEYAGRDIRLIGANARVQSILRVTYADETLKLYPTLADALDAEPVNKPERARAEPVLAL